MLGAYSLNNNVVDVAILLAVGLAGLAMRILSIPVVPCLLGLILGPMLELQVRKAMMVSLGDPERLRHAADPAAFLLIAAAFLVAPTIVRGRNPTRRRGP